MSTNNVWFNNVNNLFEQCSLLDIIPTQQMTMGDKMNAITRFVIYLSLILVLIKQQYVYLYVCVVPIILMYIIYIFYLSDPKERFDSKDNDKSTDPLAKNELSDLDMEKVMEDALKDCQGPTADNPMMNLNIADNFHSRKPACNNSIPSISNKITSMIESCSDKLYNDTTNLFNSKTNQRDFITQPNTMPGNDQVEFAKWCYDTPVSCMSGTDGLLKQVRACSVQGNSLKESSYK